MTSTSSHLSWPTSPTQTSPLNRSEEHTSELQSRQYLVCRLLLEKKKDTSELHSHHSLLCSLIFWRATRAEAIARLRRALDEYTIAGVRTTIPFAQWLVRDPRFQAGDFSTDFIAEAWHPEQQEAEGGGSAAREEGDLARTEVAALVAALVAEAAQVEAARRRHTGAAAEGARSRWRDAGRGGGSRGW